jgi:hypothetical protein
MPLFCQKLPQNCHETAKKLPLFMPFCFFVDFRQHREIFEILKERFSWRGSAPSMSPC